MSQTYEELLAVQALDTAADQMRHRRAHLPERTELRDRQKELATLEARATARQADRDSIARVEKRLEDEIALVRDKAAQFDRSLYAGTTNSPKELQAIQDEIAALGRRQRVLEDDELEAMEQAEPLDAELVAIAAERVALDRRCTELIAAIAEAETAIDAELEHNASGRAKAIDPIAEGIVATYEQLRTRMGGVAVARLNGNRCEGCHLTLSAVEVDQIRHSSPDAEVTCSECGRLLVR
ncbi:MAG: C4-type zinc ribbon domain-containing protein [Acidimicrobiales bacterium]